MKINLNQLRVFAGIALFLNSFAVYGQYNTTWYTPNLPNTTPTYYIGIGTKSTTTATNTPLPSFNLHLHGTSDYIVDDNATGIPTNPNDGKPTNSNEKALTNYGKTTRIGLTNSVTGMTEFDGAVLQLSGNNFSIVNREPGSLLLGAQGINLTLASSRIWAGGSINTGVASARLNIESSDNGLFVRTQLTGKYGINIRMQAATDRAFQVLGTDGTTVRYLLKANGQTEINTGAMAATDNAFQVGTSSTVRNFAIKANGEVFARKYTTTFGNIPDYVFAPNYALKTFEELRQYVATNQHLPNVPSAKEFEQNGVDLGEMNRLLLEKTEELTLYILQLEERLRKLEESSK